MPVICSWSPRAAISRASSSGKGEHADVEGFNDIFAKVLEAGDFESFLFERAVELRVVESDGDVAGNRLDQLDVIAGQKISVDRFAKAENRDGVLADTAGDKVVEG